MYFAEDADEDEETTVVHQIVDYYEVAVGTNPYYSLSKQNIHTFVNVGRNKTWTFNNFMLSPGTTYYMTVRAHSQSAAMSEVESSGIIAGYTADVITIGEIKITE